MRNFARLGLFVSVLMVGVQMVRAQTPPQPSSKEQIKAMSCAEATKQLHQRLELYVQLTGAYLQSNQTLEDVYRTYGEKLNSGPSASEVAKIGQHFKASAATLAQAKGQNILVLDALNTESLYLRDQVARVCSQQR